MIRSFAILVLFAGLLLAGGAQAQSAARSLLLGQVDRLAAESLRVTPGAEDAAADVAPVLSLSRLLGAERRGDRLSLRRQDDRYFAGLDTTGGQWFASLAEAQGFLLRSLIANSEQAPAEVKEAVAQVKANSVQAVATAAVTAIVDTRILLAKGAVTTVSLKPRRLPSGTGDPAVAGPPGIRVDRAVLAGDAVSATIAVAQRAPIGAIRLQVFAPGHGFVALDSIEAFVIEGAGEPPEPQRQGGSSAQTAFLIEPGQALDDHLPPLGAKNFYRVMLPAAGPVSFATRGAADTVIAVLDENGNQLGADDDSGERYNARLTLTLPSGSYVVTVGHCCEGGGPYRLVVGSP